MRALYAVIFFCLLYGVPAFAQPRHHVVKEGEILSRIARRYFGAPTYSGAGALAKVLRLNPQIENPDDVSPGTIVYLEPRERSPAAEKPREPDPPPRAVAPPEISSPVAEEVPHDLRMFAKYRMATLTAIDNATHARAQLQTAHDISAGAEWSQEWSETLSTYFSGEIRHVSFAAPATANKTLANNQRTLSSLGTGFRKKLGRLQLGASLGYANRLFVSSPDQRVVNIDAGAAPNAGIDANFELLARGKTAIQLAGSTTYLHRGTTDANAYSSGKEWSASLNLVRHSGENSYGLSLGYSERAQNTSLVSIREKGAWGAFVISLPLFGGGR